jgi:hypothetical protein
MLRDGSVDTEATWCGVEREAGYDERCSKLHRSLKRIVKARGSLDAQEAAALREAESLRMWRHYGYASLIEYMEMELGYTPRAALERLRVAKAIVDLPLIAEAMEQGDLSFSAGRELTRVATPETECAWLEATTDKNLRQVEELVAGHERGAKPSDPKDPSLRKRTLRFDELDPETVALIRQAREILEREHGERLKDNALLRIFARMVLDGAASPKRTRAPYQVAVTVCSECKRGWQDGGGTTVEMSPPRLEMALCDAQHIGSIDGDTGSFDGDSGSIDRDSGSIDRDSGSIDRDGVQGNDVLPGASASGPPSRPPGQRSPRPAHGVTDPGSSARDLRAQPATKPARLIESSQPRAQVERVKSDIPPALRRKVKHRDHGTCRVPWCRSSRNVDCHHIRHIAHGGQHTLENLICLCESHHMAHHEGALLIEGTATKPAFRRRAHNALGTVERAIETQRALKELGFDKSEVTAAMQKTRTHVGTAELTLEQWIKIALGYCPKPR